MAREGISHSPLLYDYLKRYQEDPTSRIFAPLAEAYRKAGLIDEAIEIAREGLRVHPGFMGGRVALARALFDKREFEQVITELSQVIQDVPDNLVAQRLMAEACLMTGRLTEALGAYKMVLYYHPGDRETAQLVQELESQSYEKGTIILQRTPEPAYEALAVKPASEAIDSDPDEKKKQWRGRVKTLQGLLVKVERYRSRGLA
jgi:predicted Zn-dependent protease